MITKLQSQKHITLWKPIQIELLKLIFLFDKTIEEDELIYSCHSPNRILGCLEEANEEMKKLIENLHEYDEEEIA